MAGGVRVGVAFDDVTLEPDPTWTYLTDTENLVAGYEIERGRQYEFDKVDTGSAKVTIYDRDGVLDPTLTTGPYFGKIEPLLQIQIELWNPVTETWSTRFRGFILEYDYSVDPSTHQDGDDNTVGVSRLELDCADLFAILTAIEMQPDLVAGSPSFGDVLPAQVEPGNIFFDNAGPDGGGNSGGHVRAVQVLGNAGIPTELYVIFSLNINCPETVYSPSQNVLEVLQDIADAEFPTLGMVYVDRKGRIALHGRLSRFDPATVAAGATPGAWDFTEWKAGDEFATKDPMLSNVVQIRTFAFNRGWSKVFNYALCTPKDIASEDIEGQVSRDDASIATFGFRAWSAENLVIGAPSGDPLTSSGADTLTGLDALSACRTFADYITANYATPHNRVTELTFRSMRPDDPRAAANWALLCGVDINDLIDLYVRGPGDGPIEYIFNGDQFFVEGISESAEPLNGEYADVTVALDLSPRAAFATGAWTGD
jgi:hypothetical protein